MLKKIKGFFRNKKGFELEMLGWWLLGIAVLVLVIIAIFVLKGKGTNAIDYIKNLLRFGK